MLWIFELSWIGIALAFVFFWSWVTRYRKQLLLAFLSGALTIGVIEGALQIFDHREPRYAPHHYLNYIGRPGYRSPDGQVQHNSLGFRGPEISVPKAAGIFRIALLGSSSTYEIYVRDWHNDFARQLQRELRERTGNNQIDVINAGLPGWSSWEHLINFEFRVLPLDPDLVIVYAGGNDVHARLVTSSAYQGGNSGWRKQWERKPCVSSLLCSKLLQRITNWDPEVYFDVEAPTFGATDDQGYSNILGMTPMEALDRNPPVYFERNLRNIIAVAREHGVGVMLATWAHSNQFDDYASTPHYERGFIEPMDREFWVDGRHNNRSGVALKATMFSEFIVREELIDSLINRVREAQ